MKSNIPFKLVFEQQNIRILSSSFSTDVLLAALSDCLAEHPELVPVARMGLGNTFDELPNKHSLHKP